MPCATAGFRSLQALLFTFLAGTVFLATAGESLAASSTDAERTISVPSSDGPPAEAGQPQTGLNSLYRPIPSRFNFAGPGSEIMR